MRSFTQSLSAVVLITLLLSACVKDGHVKTRYVEGNFITTFEFQPFEFAPNGEPLKANAPVKGEGTVTYIGHCTVTVEQVLDFVNGRSVGTVTITDDRGDKIFLKGDNPITPPDKTGVATFSGINTITGGTGRYACIKHTDLALTVTANFGTLQGTFSLKGNLSY